MPGTNNKKCFCPTKSSRQWVKKWMLDFFFWKNIDYRRKQQQYFSTYSTKKGIFVCNYSSTFKTKCDIWPCLFISYFSWPKKGWKIETIHHNHVWQIKCHSEIRIYKIKYHKICGPPFHTYRRQMIGNGKCLEMSRLSTIESVHARNDFIVHL